MKKIILLFAFAFFLVSCNVTESIVFNNDMSGNYTSSFDMSPMLEYASENRPSAAEKPEKEKMDTTIVFSDLFKTHKDSIAALNDDQRARLEKLKGMVMDIHMDEEKNIFNFNMTKPFKSVKDLENVFEQLDEAMGVAKNIGNKDGAATGDQLDELTKTDEVTYTFTNNTFSRFQPSSEDNMDDVEDEDMEESDDDFAKQFEMQFEDIFSAAYYTLVYTFPKKIKSVSHDNADISEDGKTVTYKVSMTDMNKDKNVMNLKVVLED
ncbi:hypothetical protein [Winogradskyella sp. R77965]|uniref:hypothetical protein n=1 Tax=Winogradskyella sp. R77965 TaxID=3093872 RepID=UPI0037DD65A1